MATGSAVKRNVGKPLIDPKVAARVKAMQQLRENERCFRLEIVERVLPPLRHWCSPL